MGLLLTVKKGDLVRIGDAEVRILKHRSNKIRIAIDVDKSVPITYEKGEKDEQERAD